MFKFFSFLLDFIFPKTCCICRCSSDDRFICPKCLNKTKSKKIKITKNIHGIKVRGFYIYTEEIREIIKALKYRNTKELAKDIAEIIYESIDNRNYFNEKVQIVPIPLHKNRERERDFNQAKLIADELAAISGCMVNNKLITRKKHTIPQYKLTQKERLGNLDGAFKVFPEEYTGGQIILLDDISTTGTTLGEAAKEMRKSGINKVSGLVLAFANFRQGI